MRAAAAFAACWVLAAPGVAGSTPPAAAAPESRPRAAARDDRPVVAVLPLVASSSRLEIYGKPVADAVVTRLGAELADLSVVAVSLASPPETVALVVDGRIVGKGRGQVVLEASVRDPARGGSEGRVLTGAQPLTQIDSLAAELAEKLSPVVRRAAGRAGDRKPTALPAAVIEVEHEASWSGGRIASGAARRGLLVLWPVAPDLPGVDVFAVATPPLYRLVDRLGYAPMASELIGVVDPAQIAEVLVRGAAAYALMTEVRDIDFRWNGSVLSARGRVRVILTDPDGRPLYQKTVATDTVVGSRGDGAPALLRFVVEQALDMTYPELRRIVSR